MNGDDPAELSRNPGLHIDAPGTVEILCRFVRHEVQRTGRARVVVGVSGGVDSAVAATLGLRALGPGGVVCLLMPHRNSAPDSLVHARELVQTLGTASEVIDVSPIVDGFVQVSGDVGPLRMGNVMSRSRMLCLFDRSAAHAALVLGTSNKTELLLGYGTLCGDMASAINPLGDLYKTQVRQLAEYLNVPETIRRKPPSADLWADQSDEEELGFTYAEVDRLLSLLVDARLRPGAAIEAGFDPELVQRVLARVVASQFKRLPPVLAKISPRSIGRDFRYPRDWNS